MGTRKIEIKFEEDRYNEGKAALGVSLNGFQYTYLQSMTDEQLKPLEYLSSSICLINVKSNNYGYTKIH